MNKTVVSTERAPAAIGPYSQGIICGEIVYTSGQLPIDPVTGEIPQGIVKQATQSLQNVQAILESVGSSMNNALKLTVFLSDMNDFATVNEIYKTYFGTHPPCRSAVQVARLPKNALIEIEAVAHM